MFGKKLPEVLVVGAGPVGLFAALVLSEHGIRVRIIDKEWRRAGHSYALALHPSSLRLLKNVGLIEKVLTKCYQVQSVGLYEAQERRAELRLDALEEEFPFIAVMQQNVLEGILEEALKQHDIKVDWNHRLAHISTFEDYSHVVVEKLVKESLGYIIARTEWVVSKSQRFDVPFVVGADGHHSLVRRALEIDYNPAGDTQNFAVFEFKTDADLKKEMRLAVHDGSLNVLWPLPNRSCRWSFELLDYQASEESRTKDRFEIQVGPGEYPMLTDEYLYELLKKRAPWFTSTVESITWRHVVRFERRLASTHGIQRAWLAGDAVHLTGPAGIQSMNVGLLEASDLANSIVRILQDNESNELLKIYNDDWQTEWRFLLGLEDGIKPGEKVNPWVREHSTALLPCIPASGDDLTKLLAQVGLKRT